ncbi:CDP-glycerol glycerophosphotransferase family protein [Peribacillus simplex]|uniref:CDP-glycerol glycerophosphotransferase family protein n=1 Tax=Peribacillus simplex TaxID=1478 RepID=UPI00298E8134|nr:CDP-glycerol glycerophosphotransferase family protein [Peribacillus simplex]MDW7615121.1 CDP-glycerol glycerophosphotransferase family protein [Peribacillus simplex]
METIHATSFNLRGSKIEIIINENIESADIILQDNETKEEHIYDKVICKSLNEETCLTISLDNMNWPDVHRTTYTILLKMNQELFRLVKPTIKRMKNRLFARSYYQISQNETAIIFLNKKNTLSIMYGNSASIFRASCKVVSKNLYISAMEVEGEKARFFHEEGELGKLFLTIYDPATECTSAIGAVQGERNTIEVDLSKLAEIPSSANLYVEAKIGKVLKSYKLQFNSNLVHRHSELSFYEMDPLANSLESIKTRYFDELEIKGDHLLVRLMEPSCQPTSVVFEKSTSAEWVQTHEFRQDGQLLVIDLKKIFNDIFFKTGQKWKVYVKEVIAGDVQLSKLKPISTFAFPQLEQLPLELVKTHAMAYISPKAELGILLGESEDVNKARFYITKNRLPIHDLSFHEYELSFSMEDIQDAEVNSAYVVIKNRKSGEMHRVPSILKMNSRQIEVHSNLEPFIRSGIIPSRWDVFIEITYANVMELNRVGFYDQKKLPMEERYLPSIQADEENVFTPYLTARNELSFVIGTEFALRHEKLKSKILIKNVVLKKSILEIEIILSLPDAQSYQVKGMLLKHRNNEAFTRLPVTLKKKSILSEVNLDEHEFEQFYWDFYVLVDVEGEDYELKLKRPTDNVRKKLNRTINDYSYSKEDDHVVYPYITRSNSLALTYRMKSVYEAPIFKWKEKISYFVYKMLNRYYDHKNIWLVYEKMSETAQDNGYHFFKYCYNEQPERNVYYIIKKDSPDMANLKGFEDRVIHFMSFKHLIYLFSSKLLIASETKGHSYVWRVQKGKVIEYLRRKRIVFLQHGVLGLKKIDSTLNKGSSEEVDLFVTSSDFEKEIVKNYFGYNEKDIIVTGLSRWDDVNKEETPIKRQIFLMPTWRNWLNEVSNDAFIESNYFKSYIGLLNSEKLMDLLRIHQVELKFYVHPKFQPFIDQFHTTCDQIEIIKFGDVNISKLIRESALLITDYSSVAWDMYYLEKPTIFYQFDLDEYTELQGSYMDMNKELFGDQALNTDDLLTSIENSIRNNFEEQEIFKEKRSQYFANIDNQNSERIYNNILKNEKRLKPRKVSFYKKLTKVTLLRKMWRFAKRKKITRKLAFSLRDHLMNLNERGVRGLWDRR